MEGFHEKLMTFVLSKEVPKSWRETRGPNPNGESFKIAAKTTKEPMIFIRFGNSLADSCQLITNRLKFLSIFGDGGGSFREKSQLITKILYTSHGRVPVGGFKSGPYSTSGRKAHDLRKCFFRERGLKNDDCSLIRSMPFCKIRVLNLLVVNQKVRRRGCRGAINVSKELLIVKEGSHLVHPQEIIVRGEADDNEVKESVHG